MSKLNFGIIDFDNIETVYVKHIYKTPNNVLYPVVYLTHSSDLDLNNTLLVCTAKELAELDSLLNEVPCNYRFEGGSLITTMNVKIVDLPCDVESRIVDLSSEGSLTSLDLIYTLITKDALISLEGEMIRMQDLSYDYESLTIFHNSKTLVENNKQLMFPDKLQVYIPVEQKLDDLVFYKHGRVEPVEYEKEVYYSTEFDLTELSYLKYNRRAFASLYSHHNLTYCLFLEQVYLSFMNGVSAACFSLGIPLKRYTIKSSTNLKSLTVRLDSKKFTDKDLYLMFKQYQEMLIAFIRGERSFEEVESLLLKMDNSILFHDAVSGYLRVFQFRGHVRALQRSAQVLYNTVVKQLVLQRLKLFSIVTMSTTYEFNLQNSDPSFVVYGTEHEIPVYINKHYERGS